MVCTLCKFNEVLTTVLANTCTCHKTLYSGPRFYTKTIKSHGEQMLLGNIYRTWTIFGKLCAIRVPYGYLLYDYTVIGPNNIASAQLNNMLLSL